MVWATTPAGLTISCSKACIVARSNDAELASITPETDKAAVQLPLHTFTQPKWQRFWWR